MTPTYINSIQRAGTDGTTRVRRARRSRRGASHEFRGLVAEFDARRRAGRDRAEGRGDVPIHPRHVIAAESILATMHQRLATAAPSGEGAGSDRDRQSRYDRVGPAQAFRAAKRIVLRGLERVDHRLHRTLRRRGFDRAEVAELVDAAMSGIPHRTELALNHLPLAPRPVEAAMHLFDAALDRIAGNLARALGRHGLGRDRIAEISHVVTRDIDARVAAALGGLAERWPRIRGIASTA